MKPDSRTISDLRLEQYVLGELPAAETKKLREALETDEILRARLEALEKSNREILTAHTPESIAGSIRERIGGRERGFRRGPSYIGIMIPVAAALLLFFSAVVIRERLMPSSDTRPKGSTRISIFLKTADGAMELADGSVGHPRDVLQIAYTAGDARYGVIFSIDGRGVVTFHLPPRYGGQKLVSPELDQQGQTVLPYAYELDDAPGFERFFLVYSGASFDVGAVARAAQALSAHPRTADKDYLRLPAGVRAESLIIKKQGQN
jgi:hypothetical protein